MAKINRTYVKNIKNIDEFVADLNGATAYIIGGNTKGKTTLCSFLINRLMGDKPDVDVLKDKAKNGEASIKMNDGGEFRYTITPNGTEKIVYVYQNGVEVRATREIISKYLPNKFFDINKFITSSPKEKIQLLTRALGVDITEEQRKINELVTVREERFRQRKNKQSLYEEFKAYLEIDIKELDDLKVKRKEIIDNYQKTLEEINKYNKEVEIRNQKRIEEEKLKIDEHNNKVKNIEQDIEILRNIYAELQKLSCKDEIVGIINQVKDKGIQLKEKLNNIGGYKEFKIENIEGLEKPKEIPTMPSLSDTDAKITKLEEKLENKRKAEIYKKEYEDSVSAYESVHKEIQELENKIKDKLQTVKLPKGITITNEGVFYKGLPVDDKHLSTSELYIVSLMLSSVNLKDLRTLYFDCSPLDRNSMEAVLQWARENDLQLLIERPDFDGGELRLEIVED